ncbi:MAG: 2-iminoacetate synthase ThiH [Candidatus Omnitrophota bacterium]|nr:2-iminoacetate synthase ThiH [Candidatus Omnitrophota bacterium]
MFYEKDLMALLSPDAEEHLEDMARQSRELTLRYFGKTIRLYTPIYISNYCENRCAYCGFNAGNKIARKRLSPEEVEREARAIAQTGLRHILLLTGESRAMSPISYIKDCLKVLNKYFSSVSVEIYALTEAEYAELVSEGVDGLTIHQETYDEETYRSVHPSGPKSDYKFRIEAPERGARAGMRNVNIGVLLGLGDWREEAFRLGLHAKYLQDEFPGVDIGVSLPRLKPHAGSFKAPHRVSDKAFVQMITALRIFLPRLGISISTREEASFRENLIPLGVTRISAGSSTYVGGHTAGPISGDNLPQFEISDKRSVAEIMNMLGQKGYQPVTKDWLRI